MTRRRHFRFSLLTLMLVMLVFCILGAAGSYFYSPLGHRTSSRAFFVLFTLVAPMLVLVVLAIGRQVLLLTRRLRSPHGGRPAPHGPDHLADLP